MEKLLPQPGLESAIEQLWQARIPLTAQLDVRILHLDDQMLELSAPLEPNRNHMGTGFAGSLLALASLAGWGLVVAVLGDVHIAHVVVQEMNASFLEPVTADFRIRAYLPEAQARVQFLSAFRRRGRGRIAVLVEVAQGERVATRVECRFVASRV